MIGFLAVVGMRWAGYLHECVHSLQGQLEGFCPALAGLLNLKVDSSLGRALPRKLVVPAAGSAVCQIVHQQGDRVLTVDCIVMQVAVVKYSASVTSQLHHMDSTAVPSRCCGAGGSGTANHPAAHCVVNVPERASVWWLRWQFVASGGVVQGH